MKTEISDQVFGPLDRSEIERLRILQNQIDDGFGEGARETRLATAQSEILEIVGGRLNAAAERCLEIVEGGLAERAVMGSGWPAEDTSAVANAGREIFAALTGLRDGSLQIEPSAIITGEFLTKDAE